jgi:hypothetical protein
MEAQQNNSQDPTTQAIARVVETMTGNVGAAAMAGIQPEAASTAAALPEGREQTFDVRVLLDGALVETDMPGGGARKLRAPGYPELLVRQPPGAEMDDVVAAASAANMLGLPTTQQWIARHGGIVYQVTQLVEGQALDEALEGASPEMMAAVDHTWQRLIHSFMGAYQRSIPWPEDIEGPHQFMWGTVAGDATPKTWLVDLPLSTTDLAENDHYADELLTLTAAVYDIERYGGARAEKARVALQEAIARCPDSVRFGDGMRNTARHLFENRLDYFSMGRDEVEALFQQRRTY